jgi:membrane associated rhomboid family serine protease
VIPLKDNIPTRRFPVVTVTLIGLNVAVWLFYQLPQLEQSVYEAGWIPCTFQDSCPSRLASFLETNGPPWPADLLTSMFMHGGWIHIAGNMLFLWIFGNNVEDSMGRARFVAFYLLAGLAATVLQTFVTFQLGAPEDSYIPNVGASGAIAGVLGAYFLTFPHARVLTFVTLVFVFIPFEIPALFFLGFWFLFQLWQGGFDLFAPSSGGGVAFFAHIGGFVFGTLAVWVFRRNPPARGTFRRRREPAWPRSER